MSVPRGMPLATAVSGLTAVQGVSRSLGLFLIGVFDIQTAVPCNFSNLPWLIFISHTIMPLLVRVDPFHLSLH